MMMMSKRLQTMYKTMIHLVLEHKRRKKPNIEIKNQRKYITKKEKNKKGTLSRTHTHTDITNKIYIQTYYQI